MRYDEFGWGKSMRFQARRRAVFRLSALALLAAGCSAPPKTTTPPDPVKAIARSLSIIRSATPEHPRVLKILFYGQSISVPKWTDQAMSRLRKRYPNVAFDARNLALGGWSADILLRAASRDVSDFYPDLIVFHVYGDHRAYEKIIRTFRTRTAADIIVQTDHVVTPVEPVCDRGLHLRWSPPPGCTGHIWFKQHFWSDFMSGLWIPTMARKYDLAVEPRRQEWNQYLQSHRLDMTALLNDGQHPNERGWALMANLFTSWFQGLVGRSRAEAGGASNVRSLPPPGPDTQKSFVFDGNRIELIAGGPLDGRVQVTVDGKAPRDLDGCWQNSRSSRLPNLPDWPALKQVGVKSSYHRSDRWTLRVHHLDAAQDKFAFSLTSARRGPEGTGTSDAAFTSTSGLVTLSPEDWMLAEARKVSGKGVPEGTIFQWTRDFRCTDEKPVVLANAATEQRHVLATDLPNGRHVVKLRVDAGAPALLEVRTYRPALSE